MGNKEKQQEVHSITSHIASSLLPTVVLYSTIPSKKTVSCRAEQELRQDVPNNTQRRDHSGQFGLILSKYYEIPFSNGFIF